MCRNIRVLHHFQPPTTPQEIEAAAIQYVRKVSGIAKPTPANQATFDAAVKAVTAATTQLLNELVPPRSPFRTREGEAAKGRARFERRFRNAPPSQ